MHFESLPPSYAPTGQPMWCTITEITDPVMEVQLHLSSHGIIGIKRFVNQSSVTFDVAPYLARRVRFKIPLVGSAVEIGSDRQLMLTLVAVSASERITSPTIIYRPAQDNEEPTALLTTLPTERLLAANEMDELTFLSGPPQPLQLVVTHRDGTISTSSFIVPGTGLFRFRLDAADYPDATRIVVDGSPTAVVGYTLTRPLEGGCRVAWHSSRGSLEQYTFPLVKAKRLTVEKERIDSDTGSEVVRCESRACIVLQSGLESEEMMQGLKELLSAEQVWMLCDGVYEPMEVVNDELEILCDGLFTCFELTLCPTRKNGMQ